MTTPQERIRAAIARGIEEGRTPGAVALIGRGDRIICHEAVGDRMLEPERRPMQQDTIFDLASVTKPVATATATMQLIERRMLGLHDPVSRYLPEFTGNGRERATILHLLTHSSGLPAYRRFCDVLGEDVPTNERRERAIEHICRLSLEYAPGTGFTYSCLGFIALASIVGNVAGQPLDDYARERVFTPLHMADSCFNPPPEPASRSAATEQLTDRVLCGVVHDENARYLSGVGGNAGLFSSARDLSRFARAILGGGELDGQRILREETVRYMLAPHLRLPSGTRGLGWDVDSTYTPQIRAGFPNRGAGHTGYTGTSIWLDPPSRSYVILLTNRVHLGREAEVGPLRREVTALAASALLG